MANNIQPASSELNERYVKIGFSSVTGEHSAAASEAGSRDKLESGEMKDHFWRLSYVNTRTRH